MPWHVEKRDKKWVVVKDEDGSVVGTHDSKEEAENHKKALYANVKE
jgi:hypothetical protein